MIEKVNLNNTIHFRKNTVSNVTSNPVVNTNCNTSDTVFVSPLLLQHLHNVIGNETKYNYIIQQFKDYPKSSATGLNIEEILKILQKDGKLTKKDANNMTSVLDNLYEIMKQPRAKGLDKKILVSNILDNIVKPSIISQQFGDIPTNEKQIFLSSLKKSNSNLTSNSIDINNSGTCAAASCEVNMADKYPAEYSRWVNKLSSEDMKVVSKIELNSLSKNPLEALTILDLMDAKKTNFNLKTVDIEIKPDKDAYLRAVNQTKNWDLGERNVADVLIQSAIMQTGSQNTYNSLTDTRAGGFSSEPQGLIEIEKTYVESIMKNKEITSLVYQVIDDDKNLLGYACNFDKIQKHITNTIDSGDDVIIGYIETYKTTGQEEEANANKTSINHVLGGHEITIVDYQKDKHGKLQFVCVDTDDNSPIYITYYADYLIPKIHHAGYPASIVENDVNEIMQNKIIVSA